MKKNCNCGKQPCGCEETPFCPDIIKAAGSVHNKILDNIAADPDFPNTSNEKVNQIAKDTTDKQFRKLGLNGFTFLSFSEADAAAKDIKKNLEKVLVKLADEGKINPTEARYIKQILDAAQTIKSPAELNMVLSALENEVFNNIELSNDEKTRIGITSSITNASKYYWTQQLIAGPWKSVIEADTTEGNVFRFNWADAIGGLVGCIACSEGGPGGCIGCGVQLGGFASKLFAKS